MNHPETANLLDLAFARLDMASVVARCVEWCHSARAPHIVITANASHVCMMRRDAELRRSCRAGDLIVADGMSVVWALRAAGIPVPERIAGVDLMTRLLEAGGRRQFRVYLLGARADVVAKLAHECERQYPGLVVAGYRDGYFRADDTAIADAIRACAPHLLFVGVPSPFKETWCERHRERLNVPVIVGVGGSFDVLAGHIRRAPKWLQSIGCEWLWRLMMEPGRLWKRYLTTNGEFLWLAGREVLRRRLTAASWRTDESGERAA